MQHYVNLNYTCNERCVFCASDLTNSPAAGVSRQLSVDAIRAWIGQRPPRAGDEVQLAGGEPTLHRDLFEIIRLFGQHCSAITLFTNGVRLANSDYARQAIESGLSEFQIALFGSSPEAHDGITRRRGSFAATIEALNQLSSHRGRRRFAIVVRLLVARQCVDALPNIVHAVRQLAPGVDAFSVNRLILSDNAQGASAAISWAEARPAVNAAMRAARDYGYAFDFWSVPLCLFERDNAAYVGRRVRRQLRAKTRQPRVRYLDPIGTSDDILEEACQDAIVVPRVCRSCDYKNVCGGIEDWHHAMFGQAGLGRGAQGGGG
jgi:MoaA/NifB/PqqE/SkfB family radical SAM enzyme